MTKEEMQGPQLGGEVTRDFEPITSQEEFDRRIKARLAREREKWEKSGEVAELRKRVQELEGEVEAAKEEAETVRAEWRNERRQAAIEQALIGAGSYRPQQEYAHLALP